ncbi:hypothetical protein [Enterococcus cecorum]|uniref:Uncharacterized protein n=1 Tax=Enterococcus cecorum TaxID=44008 RepID=A0A7X9RM08_9ENTE|nr:hypothetical protein [Enterococcus cecorum]NME50848.1 hypothetical protein [Enterococcus cecorum]
MEREVIIIEINSYLSFHYLGCDKSGRKLFLALPREKSNSIEWTAGNIYDENLNFIASWYDWFAINFLEEHFIMMDNGVKIFREIITDTWLTDKEIIQLMFLHGKFYFQRLQLGYIQALGIDEAKSVFETMINPYEIVKEMNQLFVDKSKDWPIF